MRRRALFTGRLGAWISVIVGQVDVVVELDDLTVSIAHAHPTIVRLLLFDDRVERRVDHQTALFETR